MAERDDDFLTQYYGENAPSTAEILPRLSYGPEVAKYVPQGWQKPYPGIKDFLPNQPDVLKAYQGAAGDVLSSAEQFSPEATFLASLIGPKAGVNLAKGGDMRPMRALEEARRINTEMVAKGASLDEIQAAIHNATAKILGTTEPSKWRAKNPETGRMKKVPPAESPYGAVVRLPSHLDNPPRYLSGEELVAHEAKRAAYKSDPHFAVEVADAGPQGMTLDYDALRRPWYAPWRKPQGTQMGVEGPYLKHPLLAKAYPELADWQFKIMRDPRRPGGSTDVEGKQVTAIGREPDMYSSHYGNELRRGEAGTRHDLKSTAGHEIGHVTLGPLEGFPSQGGNPTLVSLSNNFKDTWGRSDPLGMEGFAAFRGYQGLPGEWIARRIGDRVDTGPGGLRKSPFVDPDMIGFDPRKTQTPAAPKRKRGEAFGDYDARRSAWQSEVNAQRRQNERYPGELGWTEPTTEGEIFRNYTVPKWLKRGRNAALTGGAGYGLYKLGKSMEEEPAGENVPTPKELAESPLGQKIIGQRGASSVGKWGNAVRTGMHGLAVPFSPMGGIIPRLLWGGFQGSSAANAYDDMKKSEQDRQFWEAQRRGYLNKLPTLDTDTVE